MILQIDKRKGKSIFICIWLILCSMNFMASFHYFVYGLFFFLIFTHRFRIGMNYKSFVYLTLSLLMALYCIDEGILSMLRCFSPFMMYVTGFNLTENEYRIQKKTRIGASSVEGFVYALIVSVCTGSFIHYLLNAIINMGSEIGRNTIDVWSAEIMAATGQACLACLMLGLSVALVFKPLKKKQRYLGIIGIIVALAYNLMLSGRTMIVILLVLLVVGFVYTNKVEKSFNRKISTSIKSAMAVLALITVFSFNIGGVQSLLMESNLFERFTDVSQFWDNSARNTIKMQYILQGWRYPFGGGNLLIKYGYAHDLLLDGYDEFGILGLLLLSVILVSGIYTIYRLLVHSRYCHELKIALLCIYVSVLLVFCIEPILAGMAWLFVIFCFINGVMDAMYLGGCLNEGEIKR